jgi:cyanophycinase
MDAQTFHRREILSLGTLLSLGNWCFEGQASAVDSILPTDGPNARLGKILNGTLLICGGGKLPDALLERFCTLGNAKNSRLVLVPTASPRSDSGDYSPWLELWQERGWKDVQVVHAPDRQSALDPNFGDQIDQATAVWIGGGDQSRLAERFNGTVLVDRLTQLLERQGIVGGTSAGAAIFSKEMISSGEFEATLKQGFGFLPGWVIDQHFTQKNRFERLSKAIAIHRDLLGVGIDESTGIELSGQSAKVLGQGNVHLYRYANPPKIKTPGSSFGLNP